jgi:hypothetical protein
MEDERKLAILRGPIGLLPRMQLRPPLQQIGLNSMHPRLH